MKALLLAINYLRYLFKAKDKHSIHSPFIFNFYEEAVVHKSENPLFEKIESIRNELINSNEKVDFVDYGAGSHLIKTEKRKISYITKVCSKSKKEGVLLYNLVNYFRPKNILELGTSVGISTMYLSTGNPDSTIITLEGVPSIAKKAQENFSKIGFKNIEVLEGEFSNNLNNAISKLEKIDFVYIDGNHKKKPTLEYFELCLPNLHNNSIVVFDDIHWTRNMEEAWEEICKHPSTTTCIDFFHFGIAFLKKELSKEKFILKY